ncbi:hypothetical protein ACQUSR_21820 [Streptomyces sp. P1-3]|uniref:hypothetical protein n=1 Tax=Streptomyces sp. P1-3 TaxID=3421658 RepID=UPI003D35DDE0
MLFFSVPLTVVGLVAYLCVSAKGRGAVLGSGRVRLYADASVLLLAIALTLYTIGLSSMLTSESEFATCSYERSGDPAGVGLPEFVSGGEVLLPVGHTCRWADGYTLNLVPSYVNPGFITFLYCSAVAALAAVTQHMANRRDLLAAATGRDRDEAPQLG